MTLIVFAAVLAVAAAAPQGFQQNFPGSQPQVRIVSQRFEQDPQGNYEYGYDQDNGQIVSETGRVFPGPEPGTGSLSQQGSFQFVSDDGQTYQVSYVADEGGFKPEAAHLPVAPTQIPEYAQLRIDYPELFWAEAQQLL
ncbi:larval cuticle protein 65Ag1-like [Pollicipes pollicipes]|uniref:larval cuticle protein 65Ag1-like n=1 Tax=Pollicipes pollicipes TaxID=41117 RepID=UPI0018855AEC|nr:larval cuticle protein 65Ag1-like [Pollicipes pollicipes]